MEVAIDEAQPSKEDCHIIYLVDNSLLAFYALKDVLRHKFYYCLLDFF
jgi:hypothetical protein